MPNKNSGQTENQLVNLHYEIHGSGSPALFLHGLGSTMHTWQALVPALSSQNKIILVDLKGYGRSPKPRDGRYSVHDQADLVCNFIIEHGFRDLNLVGNSFGGSVALLIALKLMENRPGLLSSLILIDAAAYKQPLPWFISLMSTPIIGATSQYLLSTRYQVRLVLKQAYYDDDKISESTIKTYAAALNMPGGRYAVRQTVKQIIPRDIAELVQKYKSIKIPTLIIWGRHDEVVPLWVGRKLNEDIEHSKLVVVENAGHMPQEETPEEIISLVNDFLKRQVTSNNPTL